MYNVKYIGDVNDVKNVTATILKHSSIVCRHLHLLTRFAIIKKFLK